uniref:NADH dehydrogenase subunit 2 n=1 Tax=Hydatigera parva TaxID=1434711 RepID=N0DMK2_9CEST|nr:NADH dehydrogenase subunit 2 [Hydatigera parva]BAN15659.1 NADH dehydrogenase subunit 2 [Hydatigera parva]
MVLFRVNDINIFIFSFIFSLVFIFCCCMVDSLIGFWVFLELCGLSIIPSFFYNFNLSGYNIYGSILSYVIVSGLSSIFIVLGLLISSLYYFVLFGFILKLGLFPFMWWVYWVFASSNWLLIFFISVVMKFPILFFCYLYELSNVKIVYIDSFLTILICSLVFWFFSLSWEYVWCHISLSSVATLIVACFCSSVEICCFIYGYYFVWGCVTIVYFNLIADVMEIKSYLFWVFCFLLLVTPLSMPLIYKISMCIGILYSSIYILLVWSVYSFSEQFFLYKLASEYFYVNVFNGWVN